MVQLTRLNQRQLVLNSDLIEHIESTPDTVITLTTTTSGGSTFTTNLNVTFIQIQ